MEKILDNKTEEMNEVKDNVLKLSTPVTINDKEVTELEYDLNRITGKTVRIAIQKLQRLEMAVPSIEYSPILHSALFATAANIEFDDVERFNAKDYANAVDIISDFFTK